MGATFLTESLQLEEQKLALKNVCIATKSTGKPERSSTSFTLAVVALTNRGQRLSSSTLTDVLLPLNGDVEIDAQTLHFDTTLSSKFLFPLPAVRMGQRLLLAQTSTNKKVVVSVHVVSSIEILKSPNEDNIYTRTDVVCMGGNSHFTSDRDGGLYLTPISEETQERMILPRDRRSNFSQDHATPLPYDGDQFFFKKEGTLHAAVVLDILPGRGFRALVIALTKSENEDEFKSAVAEEEEEDAGSDSDLFELVVKEETMSFFQLRPGVDFFPVSSQSF